MALVWMIVIGFVIGLIARAIVPGNDSAGIVVTVLLGIAGSFIAGLLGQVLGLYAYGEPAGFLASILGAVVVLVIYRRAVQGRKAL